MFRIVGFTVYYIVASDKVCRLINKLIFAKLNMSGTSFIILIENDEEKKRFFQNVQSENFSFIQFPKLNWFFQIDHQYCLSWMMMSWIEAFDFVI